MTQTAPFLFDLFAASLSLLIGAGASIALSLGVHRPLAWAALRMGAQLILVGLLLRHLFALGSPGLTLLAAAVMLLAATYEISARQQVGLRGWLRFGLGGLPVAMATIFATALALTTSLREEAWLDARNAIPLLGIILGSAMNSASLALNAMLSGVQKERGAIEARLSLGADRRLALKDLRASAARNGMIPVVNQMAGAGIITLPGVMTGQILAGMDPLEAAKSQILLILLLAGAGLIGVVLSSELALRAVTDQRDRLRLDRLETRARK